jgi:hypothetical protein
VLCQQHAVVTEKCLQRDSDRRASYVDDAVKVLRVRKGRLDRKGPTGPQGEQGPAGPTGPRVRRDRRGQQGQPDRRAQRGRANAYYDTSHGQGNIPTGYFTVLSIAVPAGSYAVNASLWVSSAMPGKDTILNCVLVAEVQGSPHGAVGRGYDRIPQQQQRGASLSFAPTLENGGDPAPVQERLAVRDPGLLHVYDPRLIAIKVGSLTVT